MSYSSEIKDELCHIKQKNRCCRENIFRAMYICTQGSPLWRHRLTTEYYNTLKSELYPELSPEIECGELTDFKYIHCVGCRGALLRGIFLASGSVNAPGGGEYNLDFNVKSESAAETVRSLLEVMSFNAKIRARRGSYAVYIKASEEIGEFFAGAGSNRVMYDIINARMESDVRNALNRANNTDISNIRKSTEASERACDAIRYLISIGRLDTLDDSLREAAKLRLDNPELSLFSLSVAAPSPITKSTLNARLEKIIEIARKYKLDETKNKISL